MGLQDFHRPRRMTLTRDTMTLKIFPPMPTDMANIHIKFHRNPPSNWTEIVSRVTVLNGQWPAGQTAGQTDGLTDGPPVNIMLSGYDCWRRHKMSVLKKYLCIHFINLRPSSKNVK